MSPGHVRLRGSQLEPGASPSVVQFESEGPIRTSASSESAGGELCSNSRMKAGLSPDAWPVPSCPKPSGMERYHFE
jgi:hypothetical protein